MWDVSLHTSLLPPGMSWAQENQLRSCERAIRGFHFRGDLIEWKLVYVVSGEAYDVVVDIRPNSPSFLRWQAFVLDERRNQQILIPPGCAHGIQALSQKIDFVLWTSVPYDSAKDFGFAWNDPTLNVPWPLQPPVLSERDRAAERVETLIPRLHDWFTEST
jgi:dTDP-4-dehydrorhamnose 3,5-epimerase